VAIALPGGMGLERSFERLYRDHAEAVHRYTLAVLGDVRDAEDATQTTFMHAYRVLRQGACVRDPNSWLIAIARNVCRQRFRQRSRRPPEIELSPDLVRAREDGGAQIGDVLGAVRQLPFRQRAAFVMHELAGHPREEIAGSLGVSAAAVEMLLVRARSTIRELLEEDLGCAEAEQAVASQRAGTLARPQRAALRAHLRRCEGCAALARRQRARRNVLGGFGWLPFPASVSSLVGSGSAAGIGVPAAGVSAAGGVFAGGAVLKAAAVLATGALVAGGGYAVVHESPGSSPPAKHAGPSAARPIGGTAVGRAGAHSANRGLPKTAAAVAAARKKAGLALGDASVGSLGHGVRARCRAASQVCGFRKGSQAARGSPARSGSSPVTPSHRRFPPETQGTVHGVDGSLGRGAGGAGLAGGRQGQAANNRSHAAQRVIDLGTKTSSEDD
jgi:RNA polymerase sigma-70 factor, ECF subfamily